jgi:hypothetical protein
VPGRLLRFATIQSSIASYASFMRSYGPRWTAAAASAAGVSVAYTSPAVSKVRVTSDAEVARYRRARRIRVVIQEDVVAVSPQPPVGFE